MGVSVIFLRMCGIPYRNFSVDYIDANGRYMNFEMTTRKAPRDTDQDILQLAQRLCSERGGKMYAVIEMMNGCNADEFNRMTDQEKRRNIRPLYIERGEYRKILEEAHVI